MKKVIILLFVSFIFSLNMSIAQDIILPKHSDLNGVTLQDALQNRHTARDFAATELTEQQLSDLLWCANGENRKDGKRTAPSARNCQEIDIYVFMKKGVYFYNPANHTLELKIGDDKRASVAMQPFVADAPVILLFVANYDKMKGMDNEGKFFYGATDGGFVSQNVYLYCAAANLNTVVLGSIHRDKLKDMLQFNGKAILGQPVGYPKNK